MRGRLFRRAVLIAGLLFCTLVLGTLGFRLVERYSWFEAFYRTLTTITTVGDPQARPLSHAGRVFNGLVIFFGVTAVFLAVGAMTQTIIELELEDGHGKRRRRRMIDGLEDHIIVCGYGRVGRNATYELARAEARFLVLDRDAARVAKLSESGMLGLVADATQDDSLRQAGVLRAKGLIAALPTDAENLFVILSAKALNPGLTVVTRASEEEAGEKLRRAGADMVFTPYSVAGRQLADVLLRPQVLEFVDFARSHIGPGITIEQVRVATGGRRLGELLRPRVAGVIVLALRRPEGETIFDPADEVEVGAGDFLILMGERQGLRAIEARVTA